MGWGLDGAAAMILDLVHCLQVATECQANILFLSELMDELSWTDGLFARN